MYAPLSSTTLLVDLLVAIPSTWLGLYAWARRRLLNVKSPGHFTILQNIHDGVIVVDSRQRVQYLNPTAEALLSRAQSAIGQPLNHLSARGQALASQLTGKEQRFEIALGEDGHSLELEVQVAPMYLLDRSRPIHIPDLVITLRDITLRKEAEAALQRREAIMAAVSLTAEQFLKEASWAQNIPAVLEKIGEAADVSRVYIFVNYADEKGRLCTSQCYEWAAPGIAPQIDNPAVQHLAYRQGGFGRLEDVLGQGGFIHGLVREFPESEQDLLKAQGILSMALMPIFVDGAWWGFMGFDECRRERAWTDVELGALHTAASMFGAAEKRARTEQQLLARQRTLDLLHELVAASLRIDDLPSMGQTLVDQMIKLIPANNCFLDLWVEADQRLVPLAASGQYKDTYRSFAVKPGEWSLTSSVLDSGHTLVVENFQDSPYVSRSIAAQFPSVSVLALPMLVPARRLGAMLLTYDFSHRFTEEEIATAEQAAGLVALAIAKVQAVEQARRRVDESETLRQAGAAVAETLRADEAVDRILEQLAKVVPYDTASVQLLEGDELRIVGGRGWEDPSLVVGIRFRIPGNNPNTVVIREGKPYFLPDAASAYPIFHELQHSRHINSWLGVPLKVHSRIVGLLSIDSAQLNHFTADYIQLAVAFADQVAIALENTRLFEEVQNLALTDALTGLYNRRGLFELGRIEFARAHRTLRPFSAMMIDIDHFKRINDTHGHPVGDQVLRELARRCRAGVRDVDFVGRYGGEELVILLPETELEACRQVAERLRSAIANQPMRVREDLELQVTASLGVALKNEATESLESLIECADQAMYAAKRKGRNRVAAV